MTYLAILVNKLEVNNKVKVSSIKFLLTPSLVSVMICTWQEYDWQGLDNQKKMLSPSSMGTVEWLYSPCASNIWASSPFPPWDFFSFALLFWNQIFIWVSSSPSSRESCPLLSSVKYLLESNSRLNLNTQNCKAKKFAESHLFNWSLENAVLGLLSSLLGSLLIRRVLGPRE